MITINKGKDFEEKVKTKLEDKYKVKFSSKFILIGNPPKNHKFDLVSEDNKIIIACKDNSWSRTNQPPHGKIKSMLTDILYFLKASKDSQKILVLRRYHNEKLKETLAEYFVRINKHLLEGIQVLELDVENMNIIERFPNP